MGQEEKSLQGLEMKKGQAGHNKHMEDTCGAPHCFVLGLVLLTHS